jgi:hypothetical protein
MPGGVAGKLAGERQLCILAPDPDPKNPKSLYMLFIYGKREAKIKEFNDYSNCCTCCKAFDLHVKVYRYYYHVFFIPFMAAGDKRADVRCYECTEPIRT